MGKNLKQSQGTLREVPAKRAAARGADGELTIRDLISFKIHMVANSMSRSAAVRYRSAFGVTLGEWRTIALLGAFAPMSLNEVARSAGLDKGQLSRTVSGLVDQGVVSRVASSNGGKSVELSLTARGKRTYAGLMQIAAERNEAFLACLLPEERAVFESALVKLAAVARALNAESSRP